MNSSWQPWIELRAAFIKQYRITQDDPALFAMSAGWIPMIRAVEKLIAQHGGPAMHFDPNSQPQSQLKGPR